MKLVSLSAAIALVLALSACGNNEPPVDPPVPTAPVPSSSPSFNFENWTFSNIGYFYNRGDEPMVSESVEPFYETFSLFYQTINKIYALSGAGIPPGPLTVFRDQGYDSHYSAKLTSDKFVMGEPPVFIPGACGTITVDIAALPEGGNLAVFGYPYTQNDNLISGYYKYQPVGNDYGAIWIDVWRYDKTTHQRDTLGSTRVKISNDPGNTLPTVNGRVDWQKHYPVTDTWTKFEAPIVYRPGKEGMQPDSINVLFASSGDFNFFDLFSCKGEIGSSLWVDEVVISKTQQ